MSQAAEDEQLLAAVVDHTVLAAACDELMRDPAAGGRLPEHDADFPPRDPTEPCMDVIRAAEAARLEGWPIRIRVPLPCVVEAVAIVRHRYGEDVATEFGNLLIHALELSKDDGSIAATEAREPSEALRELSDREGAQFQVSKEHADAEGVLTPSQFIRHVIAVVRSFHPAGDAFGS